jgi:hypothetical protein
VAPKKKSSGCALLVAVGFLAFALLFFFAQCGKQNVTALPAAPSTDVKDVEPPVDPQKRAKVIKDLATSLDAPDRPATTRLATARVLIKRYPGTPEAAKAEAMLAGLQAEVADAKRGQQWTYKTSDDSMSGKPVRTAYVDSTNSFEFDFPYSGKQTARLTLRRHPRWGKDVIFAIERGQILCHSYDCSVKVRFDDEPAKTYRATEPADNSSESVFLPAYDTFAKKLETAKRVRIEVNVYQQGSLVADFDVDGFKAAALAEGRRVER